MARDAFYFVDDLGRGSALTWAAADLALALKRLGVPVHVRRGRLTRTLPAEARRELEALMTSRPHPDGIQLKWSHYWPRHLTVDLAGRVNLELFVINYVFGQPGRQPWDPWLQCLAQNHHHKLPLTSFCKEALLQIGVREADCEVFPLGYSREVHEIERSGREPERFRFLTVTNSHDLERYGTKLLVEAYREAFDAGDPVALVVKDYGAAWGDRTLRRLIREAADGPRIEYLAEFTSKRDLIGLYRSCHAFVSAHRGEGFGMKILDAMACGLPVITPLFGGPRDYCTPANCFPVEFALAPMGDCVDSRALRIANTPMWCEPDRAGLVRQLRAVFRDPAAAKAVGEQARRDVIDRLTWDHAAERLVRIVEAIEAARAKTPRPGTIPAPPRYRLSVVIPTYNRKELLLKCLRALEAQSVPPREFEVIVVDDGSTDGTEGAVAAHAFPFALQYHRQANQGPGPARGAGVLRARGEILLFIGDDIIAGERLLEHHLLAHARHRAGTSAVLGHIDWPPWLRPTPVMEYVCGEGANQFAYRYIPHLRSLDFRLFYTSNVSAKRPFLLEAFDAGVRFDPCFRHAAFEDTELAYRLEQRGLTLHYWKDALAYHDHHMDLESFSKREYRAGQMAVVFYRKHPNLDDLLQVRWVDDWTDAVEAVVAQRGLLRKVSELDVEMGEFLRALARALEERVGTEAGRRDDGAALGRRGGKPRTMLHRVLALLFDVERTRGKIQEWYAHVGDEEKREAAKSLLGCLKKRGFVRSHAAEIRTLATHISPRETEALATLWSRADALHAELRGRLALQRRTLPAAPVRAWSLVGRRVLRGRILGLLWAADGFVQRRLRTPDHPAWLDYYPRVREVATRMLLGR